MRDPWARKARHHGREIHRREIHGGTRPTGTKYMAARARDPRARTTQHHGREIREREIHGITVAKSTGTKYMAPRARNTWRHGCEIHGREIHGATGAKSTGSKYMAPRAREPVWSWVESQSGHLCQSGRGSRASVVIFASLVMGREPVWSSLPVWSWVERQSGHLCQSGHGSRASVVMGREPVWSSLPVWSWVESQSGHGSRASVVIFASVAMGREPVWSPLPFWSWVESQCGWPWVESQSGHLCQSGHGPRASVVIFASLAMGREPVWSWVESQSGRGSGASLVVGREWGTRPCAILASSSVGDLEISSWTPDRYLSFLLVLCISLCSPPPLVPRARNTWTHGRGIHGDTGARSAGAKYTASRAEIHGREIHGCEIHGGTSARSMGAKYRSINRWPRPRLQRDRALKTSRIGSRPLAANRQSSRS